MSASDAAPSTLPSPLSLQFSLSLVVKESFKLYKAVSEGVINLADAFFEMEYYDASEWGGGLGWAGRPVEDRHRGSTGRAVEQCRGCFGQRRSGAVKKLAADAQHAAAHLCFAAAAASHLLPPRCSPRPGVLPGERQRQRRAVWLLCNHRAD